MDRRHNRKGKTLIEIYGKDKAEEIRKKASKSMKGKNIGNLEEKYGKEQADKIKKKMSEAKKGTLIEKVGKKRAEEIKKKLSKARKGKTLVERVGKERAEEIKKKLSELRKGKIYEEMFGKEQAEKIKKKMSKKRMCWTEENVTDILTKINKKRRIAKRSTLDELYHHYDICHVETMRKLFGSTDNIAELLGIEFEKPIFRGGVGINEKQILDDVEKENKIVLSRQHYVAGKFIDGYDKTNNIAYEVDEPHHKYQRIEDKIREDKIKEVLGCEFVRVGG